MIKDVDFESNEVKLIRNSIERNISFSNETRDALIKYIDQRYDISIDDLLFVSKSNHKLDHRSMFNIIKKRTNETGIEKKITSLTFRITFANKMLENGIDIRELKEILGHSHTYLTERFMLMKPEIKTNQRRESSMKNGS